MIRWTVDLAGVDADADLQRDDRMKSYVGPPSGRKETLKPVLVAFADPSSPGPVGKVVTLTRQELSQQWRQRVEEALAESPFTLAGSSISQPKCDAEVPKGSEVRVFSTFTNVQGKRTVCTVQPRQVPFRGVDVVNAFLQQMVVSDDRLSARYSSNPRLYKLYIADDFTGEEEMVIQLDGAAQNFTCFAVQPLPAAKLFLFPQRTQLLPTVAEDINLAVEIRPLDSQAKTIKRQVLVPSDMLAESLEQAIVSRLPGSGLVQGSLRIKYGPVELNINEYYNFGSGCGNMDVPIAERTILSLYRFGVKEVLLQGRIPDENSELSLVAEDIVINMDAEEAQTFQQFDVIRINRYGARQQRILCIDGERLYTVRPNVDGSGAAQVNEEKPIMDIEEVVVTPTKSKYLEIRYNRGSGHENDHIECTTAYNRALLEEKLRVLRRELRKKSDEERQLKGNNTVLSRILNRLRLGFHKN
ncbi:hypothetical protein TraAM80_06348 [Trypanosoma rangeli]|uniref:SAPK-interacting protein 1 Pleckstrin-homology domain-containing protein n=1 Tax=Trypanosoma rangeli TaxID=5698 RepID=A0A3R7KA86_TRYRA|nr:uncharacterized protein TraAM80_06348 [Trypanosoma rangeli]RNF02523.1 hypothetical protein TraAM80_06348 [Trypanosoma rangeli]|eukprot:RNF02523.1 hypothetical protein TraAM80_06348 [Trypanosoma rangeli]